MVEHPVHAGPLGRALEQAVALGHRADGGGAILVGGRPGTGDRDRTAPHQVGVLLEHAGVHDQRVAPEVEAEVRKIEQVDVLELDARLDQVENRGVVEPDHRIDLALDQHGVADLHVDGHAVDRFRVDLVEREQRREDLGARVHAAGADLGTDEVLQGLDRLALEAEHDGGEAVEHGHDQLRRLFRIARGELDHGREIGEAESVRARGDPRHRFDRAAGTVEGHVDVLAAEDAAFGAEEQRGVAAIDAELQAEADRIGRLCACKARRGGQAAHAAKADAGGTCAGAQDVPPRMRAGMRRHAPTPFALRHLIRHPIHK